MTRLVVAALTLAAAPAWAQRTEVSLLAGYATAGDIDNKAPTVQELQIGGGLAWGAQVGHFFTPHLGFEAAWVRQESALALAQVGSESADLFDVHVDQVLGSVAYRFGDEEARLRPFLLGGLGATFFSAPDLEGETKFAWAFGGGLKWSPSKRVGARVQVRYNPTRLGDDDAEFCDPFGFCQTWLHQFEFMGGVVVAF